MHNRDKVQSPRQSISTLWTADVFDELGAQLNLTRQPKGSDTTPASMACAFKIMKIAVNAVSLSGNVEKVIIDHIWKPTPLYHEQIHTYVVIYTCFSRSIFDYVWKMF